jgi:regulator of protease activity HflC (stomatin/prohibitin superfamily)
MADIKNLGPVRHLRADATSHVLAFKDARLKRSGRGLSFWFTPLSTSIAEVPVDDRELSLLFHGRSSDYQDIAAQGVLTFRVEDPERLAARVDFSVDLATGAHLRQPLERLSLVLTQLAQQHAHAYVSRTPLKVLLVEGHVALRERVEAALLVDPLVGELGLRIISVRISSVKPKPELEKALEAPTREHIQQEADEAAFGRRALAVEKERAIRENELQNQIELARREELLIAQKGQNDRRRATEDAEAARIAADAEAQRLRVEADAAADASLARGRAEGQSVREVEGARADMEARRLEALRGLSPQVLLGLAARELAGKLQHVEHLNVGTDALGPLLARLTEAGARRLEEGA